MRADHDVKPLSEQQAFGFHIKGEWVRVGDHDDVEVTGAKVLHEALGLRAPTNAMGMGGLDMRDIEVQGFAPEIQAVPVQPTLLLCKKRRKFLLTGRDIEPALPTPFGRNNRAPEMVIELEV